MYVYGFIKNNLKFIQATSLDLINKHSLGIKPDTKRQPFPAISVQHVHYNSKNS